MAADQQFIAKLKSIRLFRDLEAQNSVACDQLIDSGELKVWGAGDTVISAATSDPSLHVLVKGTLKIQPMDDEGRPVGGCSTINSGELIGEISLLLNTPSTALVTVPDGEKTVVTFRIPRGIIAEIDDHRLVHADAKIHIYRQLVMLLRWRNDVYRMKYPNNAVASAIYSVPPFSGERGTLEELAHLRKQAVYLANRLKNLNLALGSLDRSTAEAS